MKSIRLANKPAVERFIVSGDGVGGVILDTLVVGSPTTSESLTDVGEHYGASQGYIGEGSTIEAALEAADRESDWTAHIVGDHRGNVKDCPFC